MAGRDHRGRQRGQPLDDLTVAGLHHHHHEREIDFPRAEKVSPPSHASWPRQSCWETRIRLLIFGDLRRPPRPSQAHLGRSRAKRWGPPGAAARGSECELHTGQAGIVDLGGEPARERAPNFPGSGPIPPSCWRRCERRSPSCCASRTRCAGSSASSPDPAAGVTLRPLLASDLGGRPAGAVSAHLLFPPSATVICSTQRG